MERGAYRASGHASSDAALDDVFPTPFVELSGAGLGCGLPGDNRIVVCGADGGTAARAVGFGVGGGHRWPLGMYGVGEIGLAGLDRIILLFMAAQDALWHPIRVSAHTLRMRGKGWGAVEEGDFVRGNVVGWQVSGIAAFVIRPRSAEPRSVPDPTPGAPPAAPSRPLQRPSSRACRKLQHYMHLTCGLSLINFFAASNIAV